MRNALLHRCLLGCLLLGLWLPGKPGTRPLGGNGTVAEAPCLYVNLNRVYENQVLELQHSVVCFEYEDLYGKDDHLTMAFYNWQRQLMASLAMPKHYGRNAYSLNLQQLGLPFNNQLFTLEVTNETGRKTEMVFKLIPPPTQASPAVDIFVNPIALKCGEPLGNQIEFYGNISGGMAPYQTEWTVRNASQSALLYQPKPMAVSRQGSTPTIQVDETPGYAVQLRVTDACGNVGRQTVMVQCANGKDKAHSLLFQPIPDLPAAGLPSK